MKPVTRESLDWEMKLVWDASFKDGVKSVAKKLKAENLSIAFIMEITDLSKEEIEVL